MQVGSTRLPLGWAETTLGELRVDRGHSIQPSRSPELKFELYSVPSFDSGSPEVAIGNSIGSNKQSVEPGTVLLCKINPRINRAWVVGDYTEFEKIASTEWIPFSPLPGLLPEYLGYFLRQHHVRDYLAANASGVGGSLMRINSATVASIAIPLSPTAEQPRIVAAIETQFTRLDAAVAALERSRANLKRYRAAVLKAACEGRLVPTEADLARREGRAFESGDTLLLRIAQERRQALRNGHPSRYQEPLAIAPEHTPPVPAGWTAARAEQICDFITKGTTPTSTKLHDGTGEVPFIKVYNLTNNGRLDFSVKPTFIDRDTHERELARSRLRPGDVLMNIVGPPLGKVSIVPDLHPEWNMNQAVAVFRPMPSYDRRFLSICLLNEDTVSWAIRRAKATAGQFNLTLEICRDLPLPIPPLAEQHRIVAEVERRLSVVEEMEKTIDANLKRAERLRQAILARAFAGKLVPQDPADEPASVLLERIRMERATHETPRRRGNKPGRAKQPRLIG